MKGETLSETGQVEPRRADSAIAVAADTQDILGESPWWDVEDQCLWWVDLRAPALHRLAPESGAITTWPMPDRVGAVVGRGSGGVVLALPDGLYEFCPLRHRVRPILGVSLEGDDMRLNDAKCSADGTLWFGAMRDFGRDASGGLYQLRPGGQPLKMRGSVRVPNAIAFDAQGALYFADTRDGRIERGAIDGNSVRFSAFAAADIAPGAPDGATVDADGYLWNARFGGGALARIAPNGKLDRLVDLPVSNPTSCAFGGPKLETLFVTTARQGLDEAALGKQPLAGALLALNVGVCGLPEPRFAG